VFDENIFPFAALHPNAGARLKAEITLLPLSLLSPQATFGDAIVFDQYSSPPNPTNAVASSCSDAATTDEPAGENVVQNDAVSTVIQHHFMQAQGDNAGVGHEIDLPT
jgi:hypothetical protein